MQYINPFFKVFLFIFLLLFVNNCRAQKILVFDRDGHVRRIRFHIHDELAVCVNNVWIKGEIDDIMDSTIVIADNLIVVPGIRDIRYDSRTGGANLLRELTIKLPAAAVTLLAIYAIDATINNSYPIYSKSELVLAGSLVAAGPIAYFFTYHKYRINKHHRLKVIDVSIR